MQSSIFPLATGAESATEREIRQRANGNAPYSGPVEGGQHRAGEMDLAVAGLIAYPGPYFPGEDYRAVVAQVETSVETSVEPSVEAQAGQSAGVSGEAPTEELPWIDVFLSTTPVLPMTAVTEEMTSAAVVDTGAGLAEFEDEYQERLLDVATEAAEVAEVADEVVDEILTDGSDELDRLLDESMGGPDGLGGQLAALDLLQKGYTASGGEPAREFGAWSSNDFADILPLREPGIAPDIDAESGGPSPTNSAAAAAEVLEQLAQRVRSGELVLPGYDQNLGDAAALAAALAALLGVKGY